MSNYIAQFYVDMIAYTCTKLYTGLVNIFVRKGTRCSEEIYWKVMDVKYRLIFIEMENYVRNPNAIIAITPLS